MRVEPFSLRNGIIPPGLFPALVLILALLAGSTLVVAAPANDRDLTGRWGFGLSGGMMKLVEGEWDYSTVAPQGAISLSKSLSDQWNLTFALQYGRVRPGAATPGDEVGISQAESFPLQTTLTQPSLMLQHRFSPVARVAPVLGVGLGLTSWHVLDETGEATASAASSDPIDGFDIDGNAATLEGTDFTILLGLGLDVALTEGLRLDVGARYDVMPGNKKDSIGLGSVWGPEHVDANTALVSAHVGLTWWFGSGDRDRDGVPNAVDLCPDEPEDRDGYNDNDGCPEPDNDEDGILDADDACPTLAEDFDGFQDEDGCPDPDNDRDGINDGRDRCPDDPEDIDGWDDQDGCPDPDNDQDGVPDTADKCPRTPADSKVDADGCLIEVPIATDPSVFVPAPDEGEILEGVTFVSGSAELTPGAIAELIGLAGTLSRDPEARFEIQGHTDSSGAAEANRELSRLRAAAVRASLIQMGISADRLTAVGYGEDRPLADNGTAEGRARNRRVEIHRR